MKRLKLYKDPLLHFVLAGALLFAAYEIINRNETSTPPPDPIHIGEGDVRWLKETFAQPMASYADRRRTCVDWWQALLEEELFAREAKTLGLDQNDTIVRRRLAQKLTFLVDDTSRIVEPTR